MRQNEARLIQDISRLIIPSAEDGRKGTDDQLEKLQTFVSEVTDTFTSHFMAHFMATWQMYFPFLSMRLSAVPR